MTRYSWLLVGVQMILFTIGMAGVALCVYDAVTNPACVGALP